MKSYNGVIFKETFKSRHSNNIKNEDDLSANGAINDDDFEPKIQDI
jgi:hypothetical protein